MSTDSAFKPLVFGITSDQFDELDRLTWRIPAHGDLISAGFSVPLDEAICLCLAKPSMKRPTPWAASSIRFTSSR